MNKDAMIYYSDHYLLSQNHTNLLKFETDHFLILFDIIKDKAISIPLAPFGGILKKTNDQPRDSSIFIQNFKDELRSSGVNEIIINQPPAYYEHFVTYEDILRHGFNDGLSEVNQFVALDLRDLHQMERRIISKKTKPNITLSRDFQTAYNFIKACRIDQGLKINISEEKLLTLVNRFPNEYKLYVAMDEEVWIAVAITVDVTHAIRYYYLPATNRLYKKSSPMVHLLNEIYQDAARDGYKYLDLGRSSVDGSLQKGLHTFKKRMGANETPLRQLIATIN